MLGALPALKKSGDGPGKGLPYCLKGMPELLHGFLMTKYRLLENWDGHVSPNLPPFNELESCNFYKDCGWKSAQIDPGPVALNYTWRLQLSGAMFECVNVNFTNGKTTCKLTDLDEYEIQQVLLTNVPFLLPLNVGETVLFSIKHCIEITKKIKC